ncbi:MAG: OsmC family protein [Spirulina sp. SIO3F2]|nr:OsmC family protein [Spirulina sp. SIO3F2]
MTEHIATVQWQRNQAKFVDNQYSRQHTWLFDGGLAVPASASPHLVPVPYAEPVSIDPEEAFIAALSSCHMLWFLSIAAQQKFVVEQYRDEAIGSMGKNAEGKLAITQVCLRPLVLFEGDRQPTPEQLEALHQDAHHRCFLANSVKTEITIETVSAYPL